MTHVSPESRARLARRSATSTRLKPMPRQMFMQHGAMLAPRPPLAAYRQDLARRGGQDGFGPSDATWLSVAMILSHAVDAPSDGRPPLVETVRAVVDGDPALRDVIALADRDPREGFELDGVSPMVRAIVDRMEDLGAFNLAYSMLTILAEADLRLSVVERGRVVAQLGRVAWKAGALDTAREQYRRAEVLGRTARIPELRVRAWIGYGIVARLRGNYPEVRRWAARAAHEAERAGLPALGSLAYHSLMVSAAVGGDLNAALVYGWRAYQGAIGDPAKEAGALLNLAQFLLECGQSEAAIHGFLGALDRKPVPRLAFPALGGLALAAAAVGDRALVLAMKARTERLMTTAPMPYECASVLLELSQALATIADASGAAVCRARALELAERHAYHELVHRLEALRVVPVGSRAEAPHALDLKGAEVARAVASLGYAGSATGVD
jgi:tetratricopeptide (TPR) repeat protein